MNDAVQATQDPPALIIRILKVASCPTLSGKGALSYHISCNTDSEICLRVASNSGGGYFSPEWVSFTAIQAALEDGHKPLTSFALSSLFRGKSVNTPSFLFAALLAERLVQRDEENPRVYVCCSPDEFLDGISTLVASDVDLKIEAKITGKGVVKNRPKVVPVMKPPSRGRPKKAKPAADKR